MSATAEVVIKQAEGVNVPTSAIKGGSVTVLRAGKQVSEQVTTGLAGDSSTIILSGLKAGETVVLPSTATSTSSSGASPFGSRGKSAAADSAAASAVAAASRAAARRAAASRQAPVMRPQAQGAPRQARDRPLVQRPSRTTAGERRPPAIDIEKVSKTYELGQIKVRALREVSMQIDARRLRRDHGQLGQRQEHADEHPRLPRPADREGAT
jgi:predicted RecA/RadA family phage recombinase